MTASPTPKLATDAQIPTFKALADAVHRHGAKVALQLFHPEYDVPGVASMVMGSMATAKAAQEAKAAGDGGDLCRQDGRVQRDSQAGLRQAAPRYAALCEQGERRAAHPDQGGHRCLRPLARNRPASMPSRSTATVWWVRCARPSSTSAPTSTVAGSRTAFAMRSRLSPPLRKPRRS